MKALTIWQPWATLIVEGAKPYEFRGWLFPKSLIGQRIAIHAGARPMRRTEIEDIQSRLHVVPEQAWTTGLHPEAAEPIMRRAWLQTAKRGREADFFDGVGSSYDPLPFSAIVGTAVLGEPKHGDEIARAMGAPVNDSDRNRHANWGWPMLDIERFEAPVPARGAQGFWDWVEADQAPELFS